MHVDIYIFYYISQTLRLPQKVLIDNKINCPRCGYPMQRLQPCHLKCSNCGAEMDCSDKGWTW